MKQFEGATDGPRGTLLFTLVNGTFAAGADWRKPESTLHRALQRHLPGYSIRFDDKFSWGEEKRRYRYRDNSDRARRRAAAALENYLDPPVEQRPPEPVLGHFLIAHSHGGNVALAALQNPGVGRSIDGLVCLATPFLFRRRRKLPGLLLGWAIVFLVSVLVIQPKSVTGTTWWLLLAFTVLVVVLVVPALWTRSPKQGSEIERLKDELVARGVIGDPEERPVEGLPPILIVRPSGDEASGLLRTSQFITWVLGNVLGILASLFGLLITFATVVHYLIPGWAEWINFDLVFAGVFVSACVLIVLMFVQQLLFAFDALSGFASSETVTEDAPAGIRVQVLVLKSLASLAGRSNPGEPSGEKKQRANALWPRLIRFLPTLAHTRIYEVPETAQAIATWATERLDAKRVSPAELR
jgi:hypothetical protein